MFVGNEQDQHLMVQSFQTRKNADDDPSVVNYQAIIILKMLHLISWT